MEQRTCAAGRPLRPSSRAACSARAAARRPPLPPSPYRLLCDPLMTPGVSPAPCLAVLHAGPALHHHPNTPSSHAKPHRACTTHPPHRSACVTGGASRIIGFEVIKDPSVLTSSLDSSVETVFIAHAAMHCTTHAHRT